MKEAVAKRRFGAARTTRANGRATSQQLRNAAVILIARHGFRNVSLRMLAQEVGIQAGSIYNHIGSKQEFLFFLLKSVLDELITLVGAIAEASQDPLERLDHLVTGYVAFHATRQDEVFIGNMELRNLEAAQLEAILSLRRDVETIFRQAVAAAAPDLKREDLRFVTRAMLDMLSGIAAWYNPEGTLSPEQMAARYAGLARAMLKRTPAATTEPGVRQGRGRARPGPAFGLAPQDP